jgi:hypothetical protein
VLASILGLVLPAVPAWADQPVPLGACSSEVQYAYGPATSSFISEHKAYGARGVVLTLEITKGTTITGTVTGQVSADVSGIIVGAQASVSASLALSKDSSTTQSGTWTVTQPSGWFAVGAKSYSDWWESGRYSASCVWTVLRAGNFDLPAEVPYFEHS